MTLATTIIGHGPRVVLLHGFTQNRRCWGAIPEQLATSHEVVLVDAPGHGESAHDDADLWTAAELLAEVGGRATYVGYSMGGRMALHLALEHPELVDGLVLIGATAGLTTEEERATRRAADEVLAQRIETGPLRAFLEDWLANPLFATLPAESRRLAERETNRPAGLAASLRACGTGNQDPLWDRLAELAMPVVLVAGSTDEKFTALAHRMAEAIGANARVVIEPGSHAVHLEDDAAIARALELLPVVPVAVDPVAVVPVEGGAVEGEPIE
ncbi:MAG: alpha/beta fold hydrolase [Acidimicrobiales bacterium]